MDSGLFAVFAFILYNTFFILLSIFSLRAELYSRHTKKLRAGIMSHIALQALKEDDKHDINIKFHIIQHETVRLDRGAL